MRQQRLSVDPVACDGVGLCAHLAPEVISIDDWGFPLVPSRALDGRELKAAKRAARGCPRGALTLLEVVQARVGSS